MARSAITRRKAIALVFLAVIQTTVSIATVEYATTIKNGARGQNQGSTEGGTLLWIRGVGFAQDGFTTLPSIATTNVVKLIKDYSIYDCKIHPEEITDTRLTCYTSAMPMGGYAVRIYENGYLIPINQYTYRDPYNAYFNSSVSNTPIINGITPVTGLPQRLVSLSGDFKSKCYSRDGTECSSDSTPLIFRIYIGGQLCNMIDPVTSSPYSTMNNTYLQCRFESNEVGVFNVTMIVTNGYGRSSSSSNLYRLSATGQLYNFQTYAIISNISPNNGSIQGDMDCDGLKKNLIIDIDGSLFNLRTSVFSQAEALWGNPQHGVGDFSIPLVAMTNLTGYKINISSIYPYRGISRHVACTLQPLWGMYRCNYMTDYYMLIIESMDSDTERRRLSSVAIMSNSGYIDLINGPQDHGTCNGYTCRRRISTFMAIVQSEETYQIYFTSNPPKYTRFRLINANSSIKCILAIYYTSLQQIDVYANTLYVSPTNRDMRYDFLVLKDQENNVTLSSPGGANYFDRKYQLAYFAIDGSTVVELKVSPLFILSFGLPSIDSASFYTGDVADKLASFFQFDRTKIRTVKIITASDSNGRRRRRQIAPCIINIEMRDDPQATSVGPDGIRGAILSNIASTIINSYQAGELQVAWKDLNITNGVVPTNMTVQEPFNDTNVNLSVINRTELQTSPAECREQSPCTIQPVLIAYDSDGNIIQKLGSNDRPWQVKATVINQPNIVLSGGIANYSDGQTQYILFSLPSIGSYQVQFTFIQPDGVSSTFLQTANLTVEAAPVSVTNAILDGQQVNNIYVVNVNETFSISVMPIDSITRLQLGKVRWGSWTWKADVTLRSLPKLNRQGALIRTSSSGISINPQAGTVTISGLTINATGMFVLNVRLVSTNNEHVITVASNGILVKDDDDSFVSEANDLSSNITFVGDYDALNASNELELKRTMIYNYLLSIGMSLISDIILIKGSIIALFQVDALTTNISQAVTSILSDPNAVPDLSISSVNINGRSYSTALSGTAKPPKDSNGSGKNIGLIVSIVIGLLAIFLLVVGAIWFYRSCRQNHREDEYIGEEDDDIREESYVEKNNIPCPPIWYPSQYPSEDINTPSPLNKSHHQSPLISTHTIDIDELPNKKQIDKVLREMTHTEST